MLGPIAGDLQKRGQALPVTLDELDPEVPDLPILRETRENATLNTVMSNSFAFGATNATLILQRYKG